MQVINYARRSRSPSPDTNLPSIGHTQQHQGDRGISPWESAQRISGVKPYLEPIFNNLKVAKHVKPPAVKTRPKPIKYKKVRQEPNKLSKDVINLVRKQKKNGRANEALWQEEGSPLKVKFMSMSLDTTVNNRHELRRGLVKTIDTQHISRRLYSKPKTVNHPQTPQQWLPFQQTCYLTNSLSYKPTVSPRRPPRPGKLGESPLDMMSTMTEFPNIASKKKQITTYPLESVPLHFREEVGAEEQKRRRQLKLRYLNLNEIATEADANPEKTL